MLRLVGSLLAELADDPAEFAGWDASQVEPTLRESGDRFAAFLAVAPDGEPVGVATLTEAVAAYAQGRYGIISELYVAPDYRSRGVGKILLDAVAAFGRRRGLAQGGRHRTAGGAVGADGRVLPAERLRLHRAQAAAGPVRCLGRKSEGGVGEACSRWLIPGRGSTDPAHGMTLGSPSFGPAQRAVNVHGGWRLAATWACASMSVRLNRPEMLMA